MSRMHTTLVQVSEDLPNKRRSAVERIAQAHVASMGSTLGDTLGENARTRLVWLGLLAMPLLFPVALPGMGSAVGALCVLVALGLCLGQPLPLPRWLAKRELNARVQTLLASMVSRAVCTMARVSRPRLLPLSNRSARVLNGLMLTAAGVSMAIPVPIVSFDNVLPALAIVLMSWGLRLRDGAMLLVGYVATAVAVASVMLLWWGGSAVALALMSVLWH